MPVWILYVAIAAVLLVIGDKKYEVLPVFLQKIIDVWRAFSHVVSKVGEFVIVTVLWIVFIGPYAVIYKLFHLGAKKKRAGLDSYWTEVEPHGDIRFQS